MHGRLFQPCRGKDEEEEEEGDLRFVLETVNMKNQSDLFKQKRAAAESVLMEGWSPSAGSHRESVHECLQHHQLLVAAVVSVQISNSLNQLKLHFVGCLQQKWFDFCLALNILSLWPNKLLLSVFWINLVASARLMHENIIDPNCVAFKKWWAQDSWWRRKWLQIVCLQLLLRVNVTAEGL